MNIADIEAMLQFMPEPTTSPYERPKTIILQCYTDRDIPYLKRALAQVMGTPDMMRDNTFRYGRIRFQMQWYAIDTRGHNDEDVFYISYADGSDWGLISRRCMA